MNAPTKQKTARTTLYFNEDDLRRVEALRGGRILVQRYDRFGNPYYQEITMPDRPVHVARMGFRLLLDLAEGHAKAPDDNSPKHASTKEE